MSKQPEALRLAEYHECATDLHSIQTAAELRRQHEEIERLKTVPMKYRRMEFNAQLQTENDSLRAQRDALLELLKELTGHANERFSGGVWDRARAAIKQAEEKT